LGNGIVLRQCDCRVYRARSANNTAALTTLIFDENGNYSSTVPVGDVAAPTGVLHVQGADTLNANPSVPSGGGATTLDYLIPYPLLSGTQAYPDMGWLVVYKPGTTINSSTPTSDILDLIHFDNSYQHGTPPGGKSGTSYDQLFYYSMEGSGNLANNWVSGVEGPTGSSGNPSGFDAGTNVLTAILNAPNTVKTDEPGNGQILYTPTSGEPGYANGQTSEPYTYDFVSVVPEPTTLIAGAMLLLPFGASTLRTLRKKPTV
jgi:hypothetical protein